MRACLAYWVMVVVQDVACRCRNVFDFVTNQIYVHCSNNFPPYTPEVPSTFHRQTA